MTPWPSRHKAPRREEEEEANQRSAEGRPYNMQVNRQTPPAPPLPPASPAAAAAGNEERRRRRMAAALSAVNDVIYYGLIFRLPSEQCGRQRVGRKGREGKEGEDIWRCGVQCRASGSAVGLIYGWLPGWLVGCLVGAEGRMVGRSSAHRSVRRLVLLCEQISFAPLHVAAIHYHVSCRVRASNNNCIKMK